MRFVRSIRQNPNNYWIYSSFYYDKNPINGRLQIKNIGNKLLNKTLKIKTTRQKIHNLLTKNNTVKAIKNLFFKSKTFKEGDAFIPDNALSTLKNIDELFDSINIINKIELCYNFDKFKAHINEIKIYLRDEGLTKNDFLNINLKNLFFEASQNINEVFSQKIYGVLSNLGVIDESFSDLYYHQFTNRNRDVIKYKLGILYELYQQKINFLFNLLNESNLNFISTNSIDKENFDKIIIDKFILEPLKELLFFVNYGMLNYFERKKGFFEIAFEDFYYIKLKINLNFIINFFKNKNKDYSREGTFIHLGKGGFGSIYDIGNGKVLKKSNKAPVLERALFEFFKHCCIIESFKSFNLNDYITNVDNFVIGKDEIYIVMDRIEGKTLLQDYFDFIKFNLQKLNQLKQERQTNQLIDKNKQFLFYKNVYILFKLKKLGELVKKYQQLNFIHCDLNPRNIMITPQHNIKLVDFDFSVVSCNNLYIFNFVKEIDIYSMFQINPRNNYIYISRFSKSIDLFRLSMYFFFLPSYIKKYIQEANEMTDNCLKPSTKFIESLRFNLYGTRDKNFPNEIDNFFKHPPLSYKKNNPRTYFPNYFYVRRIIFDKFAENLYINVENRTRWKIENDNWIPKFIPNKYLKIINQIYFNINKNNKIDNNYCVYNNLNENN